VALKNSPLVLFLVKKFLRFDKTQPFISITAILAFLGVAIGVMVLMLAMAIMNGFDRDFQKKLFTMNYPLTIQPYGPFGVDSSLLASLEKEFPELKFSPYIRSNAMIKSGDMMEGGVVFGVNLQKEGKVNSVVEKSLAETKESSGTFGVIVGKDIINDFGVSHGEEVTLIFTQMQPMGMGFSPAIKRFRIDGNFTSGLAAYDKAYMFTSLDAMSAICGMEEGKYHGIHVYSDNPESDKERIAQKLPPMVGVIGWWEQNGNFFSAMELEKQALFIVLMLIILIASLNIISSLLLTVMSRRKEIALLLSMGASANETKQIFFRLGMVIGVSGIVFGIILGFSGIYLLGNFDIISLPADVYGTSKCWNVAA
jgi:putative ABC transport system permease protein